MAHYQTEKGLSCERLIDRERGEGGRLSDKKRGRVVGDYQTEKGECGGRLPE